MECLAVGNNEKVKIEITMSLKSSFRKCDKINYLVDILL